MAPAPAIRNLIFGYPIWLPTSIIRQRSGHRAPANLPSRGGWNTLHQINLLGTFIFRQRVAAVLDESRFSGAIEFVQDHGRSHFFPQRGMCIAKRDRPRDRGMLQQNLIDFMRGNILAATEDDVFESPG